MCPVLEYPPLEYIEPATGEVRGCVIFIHGLGKSAKWQKDQLYRLMGEKAQLPYIKFIFPNAARRYCHQKNMETNCWFDLKFSEEDGYILNENDFYLSMEYINEIINCTIKGGIPVENIIIGGVSQGAILSLVHAFTQDINVKGVLSMSGYFPQLFLDKLRKEENLPQLFCTNYSYDTIIDPKLAKLSYNLLASNYKNLNGTFSTFNGEGHEVNEEMVKTAYEWIETLLVL